MDLDYHRVTIKLDGRCAAAAALWYWQPPMLGALFMPPAPDLAGVHPDGARGQSGSQGASPAPPRLPVGWEMNFKSQAARGHLKKPLGAASPRSEQGRAFSSWLSAAPRVPLAVRATT